MARNLLKPVSTAEAGHGTLSSYVIGYVFSILLTVTAYLFVQFWRHADAQPFSLHTLIAIIIGLAITQFVAQLFFFLHFGRESKPRLNLVVFLFMLLVLCIVVFGSLWIMDNLNYNMMPDGNTDHMIMHDEGIDH